MDMEALCMQGRGKPRCEDRCLLGNRVLCAVNGHAQAERPFFAAIADGVGAAQLGDVASGMIAQKLALTDAETVTGAASLKKLLEDINRGILDLASGISGAVNMASTLTGVYFGREESFLFHAGSTRLYAVEGRNLVRLTDDHTSYASLMRAGRTEEANTASRSELTCCFGGGSDTLLSQLEVRPLGAHKVLLLTSDGVHEYLTDTQMADLLSRAASPEDAVSLLCREAEVYGSRDDMSAMLIY